MVAKRRSPCLRRKSKSGFPAPSSVTIRLSYPLFLFISTIWWKRKRNFTSYQIAHAFQMPCLQFRISNWLGCLNVAVYCRYRTIFPLIRDTVKSPEFYSMLKT
jgi:hypothetical protein